MGLLDFKIGRTADHVGRKIGVSTENARQILMKLVNHGHAIRSKRTQRDIYKFYLTNKTALPPKACNIKLRANPGLRI